LIIIYNVFGPEATDMLFMKLHEYHEFLKPFVEYLNFMPPVIQYSDVVLSASNITSDKVIEEKLKGI
jgi:hypothetical protein